jgi:hypothetical protein
MENIMIRVEYSDKVKGETCKSVCNGCGKTISAGSLKFTIDLGVMPLEDMGEETLILCENCIEELQNNISNEFINFYNRKK